MNKIYLDHAAATPLSDSVFEVMKPFFTEKFYNPSALYLDAIAVRQQLDEARQSVAGVLGCKKSEVIFTAGGTESDNLAISGVMSKFPGKNCVVSAIEHDAVLRPAEKFRARLASVRPDGRVDTVKLAKLIDDGTVLVSIMYANNEIGTVQPLQKVAKLIEEVKSHRQSKGIDLPLYLHTDACQAANYLLLKTSSLGVDLMTLNGGKIYGPKQSGILFVRTGTKLDPQILGGGQERGLRSGTENVPGIVGFAAALKEAESLRESESSRLSKLRDKFIDDITSRSSKISINGSTDYRLPNNVHITVAGVDNERLMMELDEKGIMTATGSACSASSDEPSHVLKQIGLDDNSARSSLRISMGRQTSGSDMDLLANELIALVA